VMERLDEMGVDIFRINLFHTRIEDHAEISLRTKQH